MLARLQKLIQPIHISKGHVMLEHSPEHLPKKKRKLFSFGLGAHGIIAVGVTSHGVFSVGIISHGIVSIGVISMGVFSAGIVSMGVLAAGAVSMGVVALGPSKMSLMDHSSHEGMEMLHEESEQKGKPEAPIKQ